MCARAWCTNKSQKYSMRGEGGWESEHETWTEPDVESGSAFPLCLWAVVYNEEVPGGAGRIQTRSDRKTSPSQPASPPVSPYIPPFCSLSLHLYLVCGSVTFTLLSLLRPLRTQGSKRRMSAANSEWNPKTQQEHEGDWLSPHHVKTKNTGGDTVLCFCGCLDFGNWLCLRCSLQQLAGGHSRMGRRGGGDACLRGFSKETGLHHHSLTPNSCLLPRAMGRLYVVFLKLHYQKFNNSKSTLLLLMCLSVTNGARWKTHQEELSSMPGKCLSSLLDRVIKRNQLSKKN